METKESNSKLLLPGLVKIRMRLEFSRPKLAKAAGCHANTIVNIENRKRSAGLGLALKLAEVLCCKIEDFLTEPTERDLRRIVRQFHRAAAQRQGAA